MEGKVDREVIKKYCFRTYPLLCRLDNEVKGFGIEYAMETFEECFRLGIFKVEKNRIWHLNKETNKYDDVTNLREELIEVFEEEAEDEY